MEKQELCAVLYVELYGSWFVISKSMESTDNI